MKSAFPLNGHCESIIYFTQHGVDRWTNPNHWIPLHETGNVAALMSGIGNGCLEASHAAQIQTRRNGLKASKLSSPTLIGMLVKTA